MYPPILREYLKTKDQQKTYVMMLTQCFMCFFLLIFFIKAYVMGTHLNCIDNMCLYKEVDNEYTGCNLNTKELLNCN